MTVASFRPSGSSLRSSAQDADAPAGLEASGLRPLALAAALVAGGVAWYGLVGLLSLAV